LEPLWRSLKVNNAFDLISPDGLLHIVPCITRQADSSPDGCKALMREVHGFVESLKTGEVPDILVTGRAAYVDEISTSMERDIKLTSLVSLAAVVGLFWLGFRRLWPLLGIAVLLAISAVLATAAGGLVFGSLNVVAIGFCSILFGLGDDFSLLICQRYYRAAAQGLSRQDSIAEAIKLAGPGILWVALTTAAGFLALCFAGSPGFRQLGALVAIGVLLATGIMIVMLPLFLHGKMPPTARDTGFLNYARRCHSRPLPLLGAGAALGMVGLILCLSPWRPLQFDLTPASLEPTRTPAAQALALMMARFPDTFEPVIAVVRNPELGNLAALDQVMEQAVQEGLVTSFSSPAPLALLPATLAENRRLLAGLDLTETAVALSGIRDQNGMDPAAFRGTFLLFESLNEPSTETGWSSFLPENSPWWFLIDRMVSPDGTMAAAQIKTRKDITGNERLLLGQKLASVPGVNATGWSQTLASLVPWARGELLFFGGGVFGVIAIILALVYRDWRAWVLHLAAMVLSMALAGTLLKILNIPINILNVLALPLVLGVGVDYGTHIILAAREGSHDRESLAHVLKPVWISGLTTICGFGALVLAVNPALSGLGVVCAVGVASCLILAFLVVAPGACLIARLAPGKFPG
jgi:predicted exporter